MDFPQKALISDLDRRHPLHQYFCAYWERLRKLYEGGEVTKQAANEFLIKRTVEANDVYQERLRRFHYGNHLGNILGWYSAALFKDPPQVIVRKGDGPNAVEMGKSEADVLAKFLKNCDGHNRPLHDFLKEDVFPKLLAFNTAYILFDLPKNPEFPSAGHQMAANALQGIVTAYNPQQIINWDVDSQGNLAWVVLKVRDFRQDTPFGPPKLKDQWFIYTTTQVCRYEADVKIGNTGFVKSGLDLFSSDIANAYGSDNATADRAVDSPSVHSLSDMQMVPFFSETLDSAHWIGNRVYSPLVAYLNLENSLDFALEQSNLAIPVLYLANTELDSMRPGESTMLVLGQGDKAEFLEQSGNAFEMSSRRIEQRLQEMYRLAYLVDQARSTSATASAQSGLSKEQDKQPARDVLSALGDRARRMMGGLLEIAAKRQKLDVRIDVQGMDFSDRSEMIELEVIERCVTIMPPSSPTLERELLKKLVRSAIPDATKEILDQIDKEIDTNPTPSMLEQQQQEAQNSTTLKNATALNSPKNFADADNA